VSASLFEVEHEFVAGVTGHLSCSPGLLTCHGNDAEVWNALHSEKVFILAAVVRIGVKVTGSPRSAPCSGPG